MSDIQILNSDIQDSIRSAPSSASQARVALRELRTPGGQIRGEHE